MIAFLIFFFLYLGLLCLSIQYTAVLFIVGALSCVMFALTLAAMVCGFRDRRREERLRENRLRMEREQRLHDYAMVIKSLNPPDPFVRIDRCASCGEWCTLYSMRLDASTQQQCVNCYTKES